MYLVFVPVRNKSGIERHSLDHCEDEIEKAKKLYSCSEAQWYDVNNTSFSCNNTFGLNVCELEDDYNDETYDGGHWVFYVNLTNEEMVKLDEEMQNTPVTPDNVTEIRNTYYNDEERCYYIDVWGVSEQGIVVAKVYHDHVDVLKPEFLTNPQIVNSINEAVKSFQ